MTSLAAEKAPDRAGDRNNSSAAGPAWLDPIQEVASVASRVDFRRFGMTPQVRAITQQMTLARFSDPWAYLAWLREHPSQVRHLANALLNQTTQFFRDPKVFSELKEQVLRPLVTHRKPSEPIRIWVAGCSTGEEAYSIGIQLLECFEDLDRAPRCRIFATDISPLAIERARSGVYPPRALTGVSPERIQKSFVREGKDFRIVEPLRKLCVFARRDLTLQLPFMQVDLISCRHVLIYMRPQDRKRVLERVHWALRPGAFLLLGRGETPDSERRLFKRLNRHGIYQKDQNSRHRRGDIVP